MALPRLPAPRSPMILLPAPRSPLPAPRSPLPAPRSPLPAPRSPLPAPRSTLFFPLSKPRDFRYRNSHGFPSTLVRPCSATHTSLGRLPLHSSLPISVYQCPSVVQKIPPPPLILRHPRSVECQPQGTKTRFHPGEVYSIGPAFLFHRGRPLPAPSSKLLSFACGVMCFLLHQAPISCAKRPPPLDPRLSTLDRFYIDRTPRRHLHHRDFGRAGVSGGERGDQFSPQGSGAQ
jgi:hypothetical protein